MSKQIPMTDAIDMLLDPDSPYDVIIRNGVGIVLTREDDKVVERDIRDWKQSQRPSWFRRLINKLSKK